jgi:chemotaxis response regulator CheB
VNPKDHELSSAAERAEAAREPHAPYLVVGIGASAGGLDAFEQFFARMPPESGAAFVLVQHLAPDRASLLPELLAKYTWPQGSQGVRRHGHGSDSGIGPGGISAVPS